MANRLSRRNLLKRGAAGAAAAWFIPSGVLAAEGKPGANDRIAVATISCGGRVSMLVDQLPEQGRIVAVCDCNLPRAEEFKAKRKVNWRTYQSYHKLLDCKDVDALIIGTQEFQRVLPCIHACQAGKDVYAEKPLTLYVREGRPLVNAVRKYKTVFQVGTQQRSGRLFRTACELVRNGRIGKLKHINVWAPGSAPGGSFSCSIRIGAGCLRSAARSWIWR